MSDSFPFSVRDHAKTSLDDHMRLRAPETYLVKAGGNSMSGTGIFDGDLLVVNRAMEPKSGDVVVACVNGEAFCKRLEYRGGRPVLVPDNPKYPKRFILEDDTFSIWGVVVHSVRDHDRYTG